MRLISKNIIVTMHWHYVFISKFLHLKDAIFVFANVLIQYLLLKHIMVFELFDI